MEAVEVRLQALNTACSILGVYNYTEGEGKSKPTDEEVIATADKLIAWLTKT